jgi:GNAT superfamily N-acetyltransferase
LDTLPPSSKVAIREASADATDGRRVRDLQFACEPIFVRSERENVSMIAQKHVLLAEIEKVHVGFCVSHPGAGVSGPLFVQVVAVAPPAQRRGVGMALLVAAAAREPHRDIALATQDSNVAGRALIERFARSLGAHIERVRLGTYRDGDLGIKRGVGYRAWAIRR